MAIVFKTPKSALNTTSKAIQNLGGDCPPCPEVNLEAAELEYTQNGEYTVTPEQGVDGFSSIDVTVNIPSDVNNQNKTVDPSTSSQSVSADSGYSGLGTVTVNAVTSSIDNNISAGNIKKDVTILGVTGNYDPQPNLSNLNITPSTNSQEYNPAISGVDGYSLVRVNAVTAAIDSNIQAENILAGVTILGVEGSDAGYQVGYDEGESAGQAAGYESGYTEGEAAGEIAGAAAQKALLTSTTITQNGTTTREDGWNSVTVNVQPNLINTASFTSNGTYSPQGYDGYREVTVSVIPDLQAKTVNPSTSQQTVTPDQGKDGLSSVTVNAVTNAIDANIQAGNIKNGVSILGVTGSYNPQPNLQSKSVNPTTSAQTVSPDSGYDGLSQVSVAAVTSAIDPNIAASNIKSGVSILGVTGNVVEANFEPNKEFLGDVTGIYTVTPQSGYNGFEEVQVTVDANPIGSFWNPFDVVEQTIMADVYKKLNEGGYFDGMSALFYMDVDSGSIDSETGFYVAEDANGNSFAIEPYFENPDYDPELAPEDQPDVPMFIFPENFDLSGLSIQVEAEFANVTITENESEDPNLVSTYTVEISQCVLSGINWNSDMESWPLYWNGGLSGGIETSTRNLRLSTNEPQVMSISSNEPWEIEIDQPQAQSQMNIRPLAKSGLRSAEPTLEIDQMEGNAGVFTLNVLSTSDQNTGFTVRGLNSGNEVYVEVNSVGNYFTIESLEDNNDITFYTYNNELSLEYQINDNGWTAVTYTAGQGDYSGKYYATWSLDNGDIIQFKGNNDTFANSWMYPDRFSQFGSTGDVNIYGCIASMLDKENFINFQLYTSWTFAELFSSKSYGDDTVMLKVVDAGDLTLAAPYEGSYMNMFQNNTSLETAPELPFKLVMKKSYYRMFQYCSSLLAAPELPSIIAPEECYYQMFEGCSSMLTAPSIIPVKLLEAEACAYMFSGCTSMTTVPELPATSLNNGCYAYMFSGCHSLTTVPSDLLPATVMAPNCYNHMFNQCDNLTNAPELPSTSLANYCYEGMFAFCQRLLAAPELPATTLANYCYKEMFSQCWELTESPVLPAQTLTTQCYDSMFFNIGSNFQKITCLATTLGSASTTSWMGGQTSSTGVFIKDPNMSSWTTGTSGIPTGWTVQDYVSQ